MVNFALRANFQLTFSHFGGYYVGCYWTLRSDFGFVPKSGTLVSTINVSSVSFWEQVAFSFNSYLQFKYIYVVWNLMVGA